MSAIDPFLYLDNTQAHEWPRILRANGLAVRRRPPDVMKVPHDPDVEDWEIEEAGTTISVTGARTYVSAGSAMIPRHWTLCIDNDSLVSAANDVPHPIDVWHHVERIIVAGGDKGRHTLALWVALDDSATPEWSALLRSDVLLGAGLTPVRGTAAIGRVADLWAARDHHASLVIELYCGETPLMRSSSVRRYVAFGCGARDLSGRRTPRILEEMRSIIAMIESEGFTHRTQ